MSEALSTDTENQSRGQVWNKCVQLLYKRKPYIKKAAKKRKALDSETPGM